MNSFHPELQIKDTKSAIKKKLKDLLSELKGFKFVTILVFEFKKKKVMMKQNIALFIQPQKLKQLLMRLILMMCLNSKIISNIRKSLGKSLVWIIDSV